MTAKVAAAVVSVFLLEIAGCDSLFPYGEDVKELRAELAHYKTRADILEKEARKLRAEAKKFGEEARKWKQAYDGANNRMRSAEGRLTESVEKDRKLGEDNTRQSERLNSYVKAFERLFTELWTMKWELGFTYAGKTLQGSVPRNQVDRQLGLRSLP